MTQPAGIVASMEEGGTTRKLIASDWVRDRTVSGEPQIETVSGAPLYSMLRSSPRVPCPEE